MIGTLIVIAKRPLPGRVKTRLVPPLTHDDAARLAAAALRDTLRAVTCTPARNRLLAFDGDASYWLPPHWLQTQQPHGGLDRRLGAAFAAAPAGSALLVGMDTPQLRPDHLAFDVAHYDACLGPAADGGYWGIGFRDPRIAVEAIEGVPMSARHTGQEQFARLSGLGLRVQVLDQLTDVDDIEAARRVAAQAPDTSFAAELARTVQPTVMAN